jgi:hypothetical protein
MIVQADQAIPVSPVARGQICRPDDRLATDCVPSPARIREGAYHDTLREQGADNPLTGRAQPINNEAAITERDSCIHKKNPG